MRALMKECKLMGPGLDLEATMALKVKHLVNGTDSQSSYERTCLLIDLSLRVCIYQYISYIYIVIIDYRRYTIHNLHISIRIHHYHYQHLLFKIDGGCAESPSIAPAIFSDATRPWCLGSLRQVRGHQETAGGIEPGWTSAESLSPFWSMFCSPKSQGVCCDVWMIWGIWPAL